MRCPCLTCKEKRIQYRFVAFGLAVIVLTAYLVFKSPVQRDELDDAAPAPYTSAHE